MDSLKGLPEALSEGRWDSVLWDFDIPGFNGLQALEVVKARGLDLPFLIISGAIGEETAVEANRRRVHDYLLKDRLARLGPAVDKALREAKEGEARRQAEEALRRSEESYRVLVKNIPAIVSKGYADGCSERVTRETAQAVGIREYVMKPIVLRQLSQVIRKVLEGKGEAGEE